MELPEVEIGKTYIPRIKANTPSRHVVGFNCSAEDQGIITVYYKYTNAKDINKVRECKYEVFQKWILDYKAEIGSRAQV